MQTEGGRGAMHVVDGDTQSAAKHQSSRRAPSSRGPGTAGGCRPVHSTPGAGERLEPNRCWPELARPQARLPVAAWLGPQGGAAPGSRSGLLPAAGPGSCPYCASSGAGSGAIGELGGGVRLLVCGQGSGTSQCVWWPAQELWVVGASATKLASTGKARAAAGRRRRCLLLLSHGTGPAKDQASPRHAIGAPTGLPQGC